MFVHKAFLSLLLAIVAATAMAQNSGAAALNREQDPMLQRKVTIHVENEKLSTVFTMLTEQGVNLVLPSHLVQSAPSVTITVRDQPIGDLMQAIAAAVGGDWIRHGDIYVFVDPATLMQKMQMPPDAQVIPPTAETTSTTVIEGGPDGMVAPAPNVDIAFATAPATPYQRLLGSITSAQWERMWKRGYLRWSELSKAQRTMIPADKRKGRQTFKENGRRLVVR